jgi:hypothetical protein
MELSIKRNTEGMQVLNDVTADVLVENENAPAAAICGKLEFDHQDGNVSFYRVVGTGCIWVYLTNCNGSIESGIQYQCQPGNSLNVTGCHAFGCQC